jgi:hypothetical protein
MLNLIIRDQASSKRVRVSKCFECGATLASRNEAVDHYTTTHKQSVSATVKWAKGKKSKKIVYWRSGDDFKFHCKYCDIAFETPTNIKQHAMDLSQDSAARHSVHNESMPTWIRQKYKDDVV